MKKTNHFKGHRWTDVELKKLIELWEDGTPLIEICTELKSSQNALLKQIQRMRKSGIPLTRRRNGHELGVKNSNWTHGEVEYLIRRRNDKATSEEIANELNRTPNSVDGMIQRLRKEGVNIAMRGNGVRRLWCVESLRALTITKSLAS